MEGLLRWLVSFPTTISPYQYYSTRFFDHIEANNPDATIEDIIGADTIEGAKAIKPKDHPFLLGSLSYKIVTKGAVNSEIPETMRHRISTLSKKQDEIIREKRLSERSI